VWRNHNSYVLKLVGDFSVLIANPIRVANQKKDRDPKSNYRDQNCSDRDRHFSGRDLAIGLATRIVLILYVRPFLKSGKRLNKIIIYFNNSAGLQKSKKIEKYKLLKYL